MTVKQTDRLTIVSSGEGGGVDRLILTEIRRRLACGVSFPPDTRGHN